MELFLPGIAALLIIGLIVFLVIPRIGAPVLAVLSLLLLAYGVQSHIRIFSSEWRYSTWQDRIKRYAPFVIIAALIIMILSYIGFLFTTRGASALPASNVPVPNAQEVVSATNDAITSAKNAVANLSSAVGLTSPPKNNKGILQNLGNILKTPANLFKKPNNSRNF
jgi:hypothetical protein